MMTTELDRNEVRDMIKEAISNRESENAFGVSLIPYHTHSGVDSPQIDGSTLVGAVLARVMTNTSTATSFTPPANSVDLYDVTSLSGSGTFNPPYGAAFNGSLLRIRITSSNAATARTLTFSSATGGYIANSPALPSATTTGKTQTLGFEYDTSNSVNKWRLIYSANS